MHAHWLFRLTCAATCVSGCGDPGPVGAEGGGTDTEAGTTTEGESPRDDGACFAAGGRLDVISELWTSYAPPELANGLGHARGLVAHDDGLWALVAHTQELDEAGTSTQPAQPVPSEWSGRRLWQGPELVLLTGCHDLVPAWSFIDLHGTPLSASMTPSAP